MSGLDLGMGLGLGHNSAVPFSPLSLFANGEKGAWYDFTDTANIFSDTAGTTPITNGGAIARINDKSGNSNHISQATAGNRPLWTSAGNASYAAFDGSNDHLASTATIDWTGVDEVSVYAILTKNSDAAAAIWLTSGGTNAFSATAPNAAAGTQITFRSTGGTLRTATATHAAPTTKVFGGRAKISTDQLELWINGLLVQAIASDQGAATAYSTGTMVVGASNATSGTPTNRLTGRLTGHLIVRGKYSSEITHIRTMQYLNSLAGIY